MSAITNLQLREHIDASGYIVNKDIVYDYKNADGSIDKVVRVWKSTARRHEPHSQRNTTLIQPISSSHNIATVRIPGWESGQLGIGKRDEGKLISKTRMPTAQAASKPVDKSQMLVTTLTNTASILQETVKKQEAKINELTKQLTDLKMDNQVIKEELVKTRQELAITTMELNSIKATITQLINLLS